MPEWLVLLLVAVIGNAAGIYAIIANRPNREADVSSQLVEAAGKVVKPLREAVDRLEARVQELEGDNSTLKARVDYLCIQITEFRSILQELWILACEWGEELGRSVPAELAARVIRALEADEG